ISILSFCFVLLGTFYFVKLATSVSDENIFVAPPSDLFISAIKGQIEDTDKKQYYDTALVNSFIIGINNISLDSVRNQYRILDREKNRDNSITLEIANFDKQKTQTIRIPSKDIDEFHIENLHSSVIITYVFPEGVS